MRRREPLQAVTPPPPALLVFELDHWADAVAADPEPPRWWSDGGEVYPWRLFVARRAWLAARRAWRREHGGGELDIPMNRNRL